MNINTCHDEKQEKKTESNTNSLVSFDESTVEDAASLFKTLFARPCLGCRVTPWCCRAWCGCRTARSAGWRRRSSSSRRGARCGRTCRSWTCTCCRDIWHGDMGDRTWDKVGGEGVGGAAHELGEHGDRTATVLGVHVAQHVDGLVHAQQARLWRDLPQPVAHYPLLSAQHSLVSTSHVPQKERKKRQTIKNKKHKKTQKRKEKEKL